MDEFREWLSDNLRYIILILGILVIGSGVFFGVKAVTRMTGNMKSEMQLTDDSTAVLAEVTRRPVTGKAAPSPTAAPKKNGVKLVGEDGNLSEDAKKALETVINSYYKGLNEKNTDAVKKVTSGLTDEDMKSIKESDTVYSDISVTSRNGISGDGKSAVSFVEYKYQNSGESVKHAGLSWLYLTYDDSANAYKIVVKTADDPTIQTYVQNLSEDPEIAAIIERVQAEAEQTDAAGTGGLSDAEVTDESTGEAANEETVTDENTESEMAAPEAAEEQTQEPEAPKPEPDAAALAQAESEGANAGVVLETCFVRKGAGNEYADIGTFEEGTSVIILGEEDGFYHVKADGIEGYIGKRFIDGKKS